MLGVQTQMMTLMMPLGGMGRRGGVNHQNDDVIYEWVLSELLRLLGLKLNTNSSIKTHQPQSFVSKERCLSFQSEHFQLSSYSLEFLHI